jgi:aquaporin related protein
MVGAIVAAAILDGLTPGPLNVGVALGYGTNRTRGLFIEMFTTATLVMSVLMLAAGQSTI